MIKRIVCKRDIFKLTVYNDNKNRFYKISNKQFKNFSLTVNQGKLFVRLPEFTS